MAPTSSRIKAFDWLRGLAVLFMIETHALVLLRPELRTSEEGRQLNWINGLVAPSFIFAAGFSLALVQVRGAQGPRWPRVRRSLRRIGEVLGVGILVNAIWFPWTRQPEWLLRLDILPCIGVSLLLALPLLAGLARRPVLLSVCALAIALGLFLVSPYGELVTGPWADAVNRKGPHQAVFPLLPWTGYVFLGAAVGALAVGGSVRRLQWFLVVTASIGVVFARLGPFFTSVYPPHMFHATSPGNHGQRFSIVSLALIVLLFLESWMPERWKQGLGVRFIETLGMSSLAGYFFHEMLLYYQVGGISFAGLAKDKLGWGLYLVSWMGLVLVTTLLLKGVEWVYPRYEALLRRLGPAEKP
ncbi:heparan-alpha-glucosaminide N-acetyltransferase domain-containing protein [Hyalangium versicolor]|uniref:heparan-alpha-glucosaminide N-acetyltransferase domain-containing protein n=1 Tax=Hyalangium versicolor TaxID=2861190 RepID=UPI001CCE378E|nr:heparan-alpha-glucosaminide N-acetyltransferase domain-containing protein [Hyalangium versicolor]